MAQVKFGVMVTVFFDGDCAFCSRSIRLLARLDRHRRVRLSPLQGELARRLGISDCADKHGGTMVVGNDATGQRAMFSDAWITLARVLGFPFNVLGFMLWAIPRPLRDAAYRWIARNRYRLASRRRRCDLPDPEVVRRLVS